MKYELAYMQFYCMTATHVEHKGSMLLAFIMGKTSFKDRDGRSLNDCTRLNG